ncbi:hypothetical protein BD410DRAFT_780557 [Rickenella mellea]|uniref:Crinkler effector protein N-terminal domain-containing protein n=1 Tax=Rickenella mellea TaxID=50990 RepID=A0A4R5XFU7_9AGAM|nr:hypothetical protein BD410DRAFT_780557 [Rickenella mellea]
MATRIKLMALLKGEDQAFLAVVDSSALISDLKDEVQERRKRSALKDIDAADLNLWKVETPMSAINLSARLSEAGVSELCVQMPPEDPVLKWLPTQPTSCVHFVVEIASADFTLCRGLWHQF